MLTAHDVHARIGRGGWAAVLADLGVAPEFLRPRKQGPCPVCNGVDRYCFDDRSGHGDFICRRCGAGDGFHLLMRLHGWTFAEAMRRVMEATGMAIRNQGQVAAPVARSQSAPAQVANPSRRVLDMRRSACQPEDVADVREYLASRALWPLPPLCGLRAHAGADYWNGRTCLGRFPALVAPVSDIQGELVTLHLTYLCNGRKLDKGEPRKMLSPLVGHVGCAVSLMPFEGDTLGIAEGIETALSAHQLHGVPTWSVLTTSLLTKFEPPPQVRNLIVFADNDPAGLLAAARLLERLQGRVTVELHVPTQPHKDFNDQLVNQS